MGTNVLPFDVPDDLPYEWLYHEDITTPHAFACETTVNPPSWDRYTKVHQCTAPAKFRAMPDQRFTEWKPCNVCGTHARVLERDRAGWELEPLPG